MGDDYVPDNDATAGDPWNVAFLSDRDVSGQVPINYVPHPGVFLTSACFSDNVFDDGPFMKCFSNLLASEIRRFVVDIYWDTLNRRWSLCPAEIPILPQDDPDQNGAQPLLTRANHFEAPGLVARQTVAPGNTTTSFATLTSGNSTLVTATTSTRAAVVTTEAPSGSTLYQIGPYQCTSSIGIDTFVNVFAAYLSATSDTISARLQLIVFNLHAAALAANPTAPRPNLTDNNLPGPEDVLSLSLEPLTNSIYTPVNLNADRQNINNSWFARRPIEWFPLTNYYTIDRLSGGDLSTPDGWPDEDYVQLEQGWRFLAGYGPVDSQMDGYNFAADNAVMFAPSVLHKDRAAKLDDQGRVVSGCFYNISADRINQIDNSWAVSSIVNVLDQTTLGNAADNLTICGMSPLLNSTLAGVSAGINYEPYQTFGNQALFSWASGEPQNLTSPENIHNSPDFACALMVSNDNYTGHWRVSDCGNQYRVACRVSNQPYVWQLSPKNVTYRQGPAACIGADLAFDVPRTGLENLYLYRYISSLAVNQSDPSVLDGVWVNFNSIDFEDCWVTTGPDGLCPYLQDEETLRQRRVLIPAIGAFIVLLLTVLTILVKCNTNRRNSKVRKRGEGGWDYEGVPS